MAFGGDGPRWRLEFPYRWDRDDAVTRRALLRFAVWTSGALFASTTALALASRALRPAQPPRVAIARVDELRDGEARYFTYPPGEQAVLVRTRDGELVAFSQRCTHLSCAVVYQPDAARFYCPCHDGVFEVRTGVPTAGPPRRPLARIALRTEDGVVYAVGMTP
jgi:nitrite reductase/ring-hydroxylating ferredoxin subunit